jgi:hypothetical protein
VAETLREQLCPATILADDKPVTLENPFSGFIHFVKILEKLI